MGCLVHYLLSLKLQSLSHVDQVSCIIFLLRLLIVPSPGKHPRPEDDVAPEPQRVRYNSASGNIQIVEVDPAGKFIQIRNMSDKVRTLERAQAK